MGDYRRKLFLGTQFPRLAILLAALVLYSSAASPWFALRGLSVAFPTPVETTRSETPAVVVTPSEALIPDISATELAADQAALAASNLRFISQGQADATLGGAARTNALISMYFIDGYVIEPGARFSFDDVARTWDLREDPSYLWSVGTTRYGLVSMRGGGACWVSTALWRAALYAGLPTEYRQNHLGALPNLGIGTDATNTLVIRNDSEQPITVRAWMDDEAINVALLASDKMDRKGNVRGPTRAAPGSYVLYQDVTWDDGRVTTTPFYSGYYW